MILRRKNPRTLIVEFYKRLCLVGERHKWEQVSMILISSSKIKEDFISIRFNLVFFF